MRRQSSNNATSSTAITNNTEANANDTQLATAELLDKNGTATNNNTPV